MKGMSIPSPVRLFAVAALLLAGVAAAGCDVQVGDKGLSFDIASGKATEDWTRSYDLKAGGRLDVVNINGRIEVGPSSSTKVEIHAHREAKAGSDEAARELLAQSKMVEDVAPDHVRVEVQRSGEQGRRFGRSVNVEFDVQIPPGLAASFRTANGGVTLQNVSGTLTAATTNGGVTGRDLSGPVSATTVNGGVQLALSKVTGNVDASAVNGGIRIELPSDTNAQLDATVVNGGISVDDSLKLSGGEQDRRHVSGTLNAGGPKISAQTTNGGVRIYSSGSQAPGQRGR